jgi:thiamine-monophosphate kinase
VRLGDVGELGLIRRLREGALESRPGVLVGLGDDAAVLAPTPGAALLATTDLVIEDVHFRRATATPRDVGWKALAVNVSDIAAMGGVPRWALVALAVPEATPLEEVLAFYAGMQEVAGPHGMAIVGGDTSASPAGVFVNVTVLGEHDGTPRLRSMARPGQLVAVTGSLGRAAAGLRVLETRAGGRDAGVPEGAAAELVAAHLRPTPRVAEGRWLAAQPAVHAMMDCSDGLATDLAHICEESGVGARVALPQVPVAAATRQAARALGQDPLAWAVSGGEDYELLVTVEAAEAPRLSRGLEAATGTPLTVIGEVTRTPGRPEFVDERGAAVAVRPGWVHFQAEGSPRG